MRIKLLAAANRDLKEIRSYIAIDDPKAAAQVVARLVKSVELIAEKPQIGRSLPESIIREWSVPGVPYLIAYRVRGEVLDIIRIFHTSQRRPSRWIG